MGAGSPRFRKSLAGLAVGGVVVQLDLSAGALFGGVNHAGIEGARIDVQADGTLVEFAGIQHTMHGLLRIDGAGLGDIHLDDLGGLQFAAAGGDVLLYDMEILHLQAADGHRHPTVLIAMVVDGTGLTDLPTDGQQFIERSLVDQIAGVVLAVPG